MSTDTLTAAFTSLYEVCGAPPARADYVKTTEDSQKLADNIGLIRAFEKASWSAFVYGAATVVNVKTGKKWTINVAEAK